MFVFFFFFSFFLSFFFHFSFGSAVVNSVFEDNHIESWFAGGAAVAIATASLSPHSMVFAVYDARSVFLSTPALTQRRKVAGFATILSPACMPLRRLM